MAVRKTIFFVESENTLQQVSPPLTLNLLLCHSCTPMFLHWHSYASLWWGYVPCCQRTVNWQPPVISMLIFPMLNASCYICWIRLDNFLHLDSTFQAFFVPYALEVAYGRWKAPLEGYIFVWEYAAIPVLVSWFYKIWILKISCFLSSFTVAFQCIIY